MIPASGHALFQSRPKQVCCIKTVNGRSSIPAITDPGGNALALCECQKLTYEPGLVARTMHSRRQAHDDGTHAVLRHCQCGLFRGIARLIRIAVIVFGWRYSGRCSDQGTVLPRQGLTHRLYRRKVLGGGHVPADIGKVMVVSGMDDTFRGRGGAP